MLGRLARWWQDRASPQCRDCGLAVADAKDGAYLWEEDQEVILAAREMVADGDGSTRLKAAIVARDVRAATRLLQ